MPAAPMPPCPGAAHGQVASVYPVGFKCDRGGAHVSVFRACW